MIKIVLIGLLYDTNLGDPLLFDCTRYLLNKVLPQAEVVCVDLYGRIHDQERSRIESNQQKQDGLKLHIAGYYHILNRELAKFLQFTIGDVTTKFMISTHAFNKRKSELKEKYLHYFDSSDLIIIVGAGTIKYDVRLDFGPYYQMIVRCAKELGVPVLINAAGIESRYDHSDIRCRRFSKVLSNDIIKVITTRDNIDELRKYIKNDSTIVDKICDPGIWASDTFGIDRNNETKIVGIGVITPKRFVEFKTGFTDGQYISTIKQIIHMLERNNVEWKLFTNGDSDDNQFAFTICKEMDLDSKTDLYIPESPRELVEIISSFKAVITSRLHSCIIAYSLEIPFVAVSWNRKVDYFAANIGCPERVISSYAENTEQILHKLYRAIEEGYDLNLKGQLVRSSIINLKDHLDKSLSSVNRKNIYEGR